MSPHVGNFVQDLVEMAKAMDELPQVKANLVEANEFLEMERQTVQDRELTILRYKQEIDDLQSALRHAEVARDDAELRFLEVEDKLNHVLDRAKTVAASMDAVIRELDPPKPEPMVEASPLAKASPTEPHGGSFSQSSVSDVPEGQSEPDPTATTALEGSPNATSDHANEPEPASANPSPGPYSGLNYFDFPSYVPYDAWLAGGGTDADYWHRRAEQLTA